MDGSIFISYRRGDGPGFAGRLYDRLEQEFSPERVFLDVDNIAPGLDFVEVLHNKVAACDVLLAVIGRNWAEARDGNGELRLHNPDDFVRIEIEQALSQGKRVIPVLVDGAEMPPRKAVPLSLHPLLRRNAVRLTHEGFRSDVDRLVAALEEALAEIRKAPKAGPPTRTDRALEADRPAVADAPSEAEEARGAVPKWADVDSSVEKAGHARDQQQDATDAKAAGAKAEALFEALRQETLKLADTSKMIRFLYARTEGEQRVSQVRDLLSRMGVTTHDGQPISYLIVFDTVNRAPKRDDVDAADPPRKQQAEVQAGLKERQEKDEESKLSRLRAAEEKAARGENKTPPPPPTIVAGPGDAGATATDPGDVSPLVKEPPPEPGISRRFVIGAAAIGVGAAAWFTRGSWLPGGDIRTLDEPAKIVSNQPMIYAADFDPFGQSFVTGGVLGSVALWSLAGARDFKLDGHKDEVTKAVFSPARDGARLLTVSADGRAFIRSGERYRDRLLLQAQERALRAGWHRHGTHVAIGGRQATLWDAQKGKLVRTLDGHRGPVIDLAFASWGDVLATASEDGTAQLWDAAGAGHFATLDTDAGPVFAVVISPLDGHVVTLSKGGTAMVWAWAQIGPLTSLRLESRKENVSAGFSPDGLQIVTAAADGTGDLWGVKGKHIAALEGHEGPLTSAHFSPGGSLILTTSRDKTARLWSPRTRKTVAILTGHTGAVTGAKFSRDGTYALTWSEDLSARVWSIPRDLILD